MKRLHMLRNRALNQTFSLGRYQYLFWKSFEKNHIYKNAYRDMMTQLTPLISEGELIVGSYGEPMSPEESTEWENRYLPLFQKTTAHVGQDSHMAIDYELVLHCGLSGIINKIEKNLKSCKTESVSFYENCKACLLAVISFSQSYSDHAQFLAEKETDNTRKEELLEIARICRKVPMQPADNFYEAVQSVHFISLCLSMNPFRLYCQQFQLGHPDRYLLPFYEKDLKNGSLTKERAQLLLDCLGIQINMRVHNGLSSGYMVGGRNTNGAIAENELTYMCMQVIDDIRLVYPAVGLCYTEGMNDAVLKKACKILSHGCSHPAVFNDDIITKGLIAYGVPEEEAHHYIHSTCVEITPVASSNAWVASPYTNMAQLLLDIMNREYESFEAFLSVFLKNLDNRIQENFEAENKNRALRASTTINPLLSCFVKDCLAQGKDIEQGGAKYNWIMPSFVGMANLTDALYVIKELVFEKKEYTLLQLKEITDKNFERHEDLKLRILNTIPKYGNDINDVDMLFDAIIKHIVATCKKHTCMYQNGKLIPSVFCWIMHEHFGRETNATPDGRLAGFPLADGSGPCQGREANGPTASILSSTKWDHSELIGGVAVNMKFSKHSLGDDSIETITYLLKTFLARGGFEIQINVVDKETLLDAVKKPEQYRDLVVRIGGYSDYFTRLSPQMQQEVILRTEHNI